jgi:hypothetical protein
MINYIPIIILGVLIILRITNVITWSWWIVLFPLILTGSLLLISLIIINLFSVKKRND